jgi:hypothetical protein
MRVSWIWPEKGVEPFIVPLASGSVKISAGASASRRREQWGEVMDASCSSYAASAGYVHEVRKMHTGCRNIELAKRCADAQPLL